MENFRETLIWLKIELRQIREVQEHQEKQINKIVVHYVHLANEPAQTYIFKEKKLKTLIVWAEKKESKIE